MKRTAKGALTPPEKVKHTEPLVETASRDRFPLLAQSRKEDAGGARSEPRLKEITVPKDPRSGTKRTCLL
jgi:hypothetical protein